MADDVRVLSDMLARDPASLVYADLAEQLRRRGDLEQALRVAEEGLSRHPDHADGLACLGRIRADRGELDGAQEAWARALAVAPWHVGALKGMGFTRYRAGDVSGAAELLALVVAAVPSDEGARRALAMVRQELGVAPEAPPAATPASEPEETPPSELAEAPAVEPEAAPAFELEEVPAIEPEGAPAFELAEAPAIEPEAAPAFEPAAVPASGPVAVSASEPVAAPAAGRRPPIFRGLEGAAADILLCDDRGRVIAGGLTGADASDASDLAAAELAGVSGEAQRTAQHLGLGAWQTIVAETDHATLVLAPVSEGALLLVRRDRSVPIGLAVRGAERALRAAAAWLEDQGV